MSRRRSRTFSGKSEPRCYAENVAIVDLQTARAAKQRLIARLPRNAPINGVGLQPVEGGYALKVNLLTADSDLELPATVDGVDVHVAVSGPGFPQIGDREPLRAPD